jgi:hypothetical protein
MAAQEFKNIGDLNRNTGGKKEFKGLLHWLDGFRTKAAGKLH